MAESVNVSSETREDVLHVPNLFDFFCSRTSEEMRSRGSATSGEAPATSFAGLVVSLLLAFAFYVFGRPQMAKATFVLFGVILLWTAWGVIIRSSEQLSQKADSIKAGVFPPTAAPYVIARLKWWNHLVVPMRWGRHSRLFDRKTKLERKIEDIQRRITEAIGRTAVADYQPPGEEEILALGERINAFSDRNDYEMQIPSIDGEVAKLRAELTLYLALMAKVNEMEEKLNRIEKLSIVFHNLSPDDLSQVVAEAIQLLEERRILVLNVDTIEPEDFIDLVTVRVA